MIKDENYFVIQGWMRNKLKLSGNDLLAYAVIYGFSQDEKSEYKGTVSYLSDFTGASYATMIRVLIKLENLGYIIKEEFNSKTGKTNAYKCVPLSKLNLHTKDDVDVEISKEVEEECQDDDKKEVTKEGGYQNDKPLDIDNFDDIEPLDVGGYQNDKGVCQNDKGGYQNDKPYNNNINNNINNIKTQESNIIYAWASVREAIEHYQKIWDLIEPEDMLFELKPELDEMVNAVSSTPTITFKQKVVASHDFIKKICFLLCSQNYYLLENLFKIFKLKEYKTLTRKMATLYKSAVKAGG